MAALEAGGVLYRVSGFDKAGALREVVELLRLPDEVDREFLLRVLLAREAIAPTAIGDGIAIPHVRNPVVLHVGRPSITLCFLEQPIEYGALDGKPVHTLFTIVSPTTRAHLHLMSKLSFVLRDAGVRRAIETQESRPQLLREVGACRTAARSVAIPPNPPPVEVGRVALGLALERSGAMASPRSGKKISMQLTVRDVSKFLKVSESTVTRWIKQRGLPSHHVGGHYRFNRVELLEWATANKIKVSVEAFDELAPEDEPSPSLVEALEAGGIFHRIKDSTKDVHCGPWSRYLPLPEGVDRELLLRLFLAREASASTAIGDGIALPHVRNPIVLHVVRPMVTLCFLEHPVDFGALDGKPVHVLFSLICPTVRSHLQILSRLSYALQDEKFKEVVMRQGQREEILREARRVEAALAAPTNRAGR